MNITDDAIFEVLAGRRRPARPPSHRQEAYSLAPLAGSPSTVATVMSTRVSPRHGLRARMGDFLRRREHGRDLLGFAAGGLVLVAALLA